MRKIIVILSVCLAMIWLIGCGTQNEYLSKGKEWVKSDKRGRISRAVAQFELAIEKEPTNAEAHYLLGYYDDSATIERRAEQMVLAYKYDKKKYLKILIEETIRDRNEKIRNCGILALQTIHSQMDSIINPLIKKLKSKDSRDRDNAALVLSKLSNHNEVVDRLMQKDIIKHKRMGTRFGAVRALGNIGDPKSIDALMERITVLKTEEEKGEEPEVRRVAVVALKQISKRKIDINVENKQLLDIQIEPVEQGVKVAQDISGELASKVTLKKDEIISSVINNKKVSSLNDFKELVDEASINESVTFGIPKLVNISASSIDELGIIWDESKSLTKGMLIKGLAVDSKAGKLGIEKGEIISYINNKPINSINDYKEIVTEAIINKQELTFTIANEDKYKEVTVILPEIPQIKETSDSLQESKMQSRDLQKILAISNKDQKVRLLEGTTQATMNFPDLGISIQALPNGAEGIVIVDIEPQSPAIDAGLRLGQVISYVVSEKKVTDVDQFRQLVNQGFDDGKVTITVINKTAIDKLIKVLRNKGLIVRFDAAIALGELKDKTAVDTIIEMLQEQANPIEVKL
ncbi:TPA: PDZ domain-containing protein [bacterium]|nr:PDZ domain-containing protein [bacterium]